MTRVRGLKGLQESITRDLMKKIPGAIYKGIHDSYTLVIKNHIPLVTGTVANSVSVQKHDRRKPSKGQIIMTSMQGDALVTLEEGVNGEHVNTTYPQFLHFVDNEHLEDWAYAKGIVNDNMDGLWVGQANTAFGRTDKQWFTLSHPEAEREMVPKTIQLLQNIKIKTR